MYETIVEYNETVSETVLEFSDGETVITELSAVSEIVISDESRQGIAGRDGVIDASTLVIGEIPSGEINGSNAVFTSAYDFFPETVNVTINGLKQQRIWDFNTSGTRQIHLTASLQAGERISIDYLRS